MQRRLHNWSVELVRYTPVTTKVSVRNFTDKLVKVASNNEDFVKNPALLYYKYNEHPIADTGTNERHARLIVMSRGGAIRRFRRITMRPSTWEVASGSGAVSDNATTTFTFAKFDSTGPDQQTGPSQPARAFSQPLPVGNRMVTLSRSTG